MTAKTYELQEKIINDVLAFENPNVSKVLDLQVIEIVHPSKLEQFYESNKFVIRKKHSREKSNIEVTDRSKIYDSCTKFLYDNKSSERNRGEIRQDLYKLSIVGYLGDKDKTRATFYDHVIAEIDFSGKKYFRIDSHWYHLQDQFIERMNVDAADFFIKFKLEESLLESWPYEMEEKEYNLLHANKKDYYVLDRVLNGNIELCDLMIIKGSKLFLVHVKDGFDATTRDLYIQVILSAKKLQNDLNSNLGRKFKETLERYNTTSNGNKIDVAQLHEKVISKEYSITYVMAYNNRAYKGKTVHEKMKLSKSNIAKYSLVQTIKEMQNIGNFDIEITDISEG